MQLSAEAEDFFAQVKAGLDAAVLNVRINLPSVREGPFKTATLAEVAELQAKSAGPLSRTLAAVDASLPA